MSRHRAKSCRSGLAPLELVMVLPVLILVTALIINIGVIAMWRVRGEIVSRDTMWRSRWPRTGGWESPPSTWPAGAVATVRNDQPIAELDLPHVQHEVVRGPLPNGFRVGTLLAPAQGSRKGISAVNRRYPLLSRLGNYESGDIDNPLLDYKWPCSEMGIPNVFRRTKRLYVLPETDQRFPGTLAAATANMFSMPNWNDLAPLDRDPDMLRYRGGYVDFHPWIRHPYPPGRLVVPEYCLLDQEVVRETEVNRLVDTLDERGRAELHEISKLPRHMTSAFLRMYQQALDQLNSQIAACNAQIQTLMEDDIPDMETIQHLQDTIAWAQSEIDRIEAHIEPLRTYQSRLPDIEEELRKQFEQNAS